MKILYIGVHSEENWRSEFWISKAFTDLSHSIVKYNYKSNRKKLKSWIKIGQEIFKLEKQTNPDIIFLQRGRKMSVKAINKLTRPIIFWSTEPIQLKNDVDKLLKQNLFNWIFVHSYSCLDRIKLEFPQLLNKCSVMHNACPQNIITDNDNKIFFAIFNRNLSQRRKKWLKQSIEMINVIKGKYGDEYFNDLKKSKISINIHYSDKNLDDFETGIFEALACGCVVISEKLCQNTIDDLNAHDIIIQINSPDELKKKLSLFKSNPELLNDYLYKTKKFIQKNTWYNRAISFIDKFNQYI